MRLFKKKDKRYYNYLSMKPTSMKINLRVTVNYLVIE